MTNYEIVCSERNNEEWTFVDVEKRFRSYKEAAAGHNTDSPVPLNVKMGYSNLFGMCLDYSNMSSPTFQAIHSNIFKHASALKQQQQPPEQPEPENNNVAAPNFDFHREIFGISLNHEIGYNWNRYARKKRGRRMHSPEQPPRTPANSPTGIAFPNTNKRTWFPNPNPFNSLYNSDSHSEESFASESPTREYYSD